MILSVSGLLTPFLFDDSLILPGFFLRCQKPMTEDQALESKNFGRYQSLMPPYMRSPRALIL